MRPTYTVIMKVSARKELRAVPKQYMSAIVAKITQLAAEPRPFGSEKLSGYRDRYRIRHADYRIVYQIQQNILLIEIIKIGHRKEVYKKLK